MSVASKACLFGKHFYSQWSKVEKPIYGTLKKLIYRRRECLWCHVYEEEQTGINLGNTEFSVAAPPREI